MSCFHELDSGKGAEPSWGWADGLDTWLIYQRQEPKLLSSIYTPALKGLVFTVGNTAQPQCDWTDSHGSSFILRLRRYSYNPWYGFKNLSLISKIIQGFHLLNTNFFSIFLIAPHVHSHEKCAALKAAAPTAWKLQTNLPHGASLEHDHSTSMQTFRDSARRLHSLFPLQEGCCRAEGWAQQSRLWALQFDTACSKPAKRDERSQTRSCQLCSRGESLQK